MTEINLNKCLVTKSHFGYNEYYNVCTHKVQDVVPWTSVDYAGFTFFLAIIVIVIMAIAFAGYIIYDSL